MGLIWDLGVCLRENSLGVFIVIFKSGVNSLVVYLFGIGRVLYEYWDMRF